MKKKKLAALTLQYELISLITKKDKKKWIVKHTPSGYDDTIKNALMNLCHANQDTAYVVTYKDMQNKINGKYESFAKTTKKRTMLSFLLYGGQGDSGGGRGGSIGGGRGQGELTQRLSQKQQSKRDKGANKKKTVHQPVQENYYVIIVEKKVTTRMIVRNLRKTQANCSVLIVMLMVTTNIHVENYIRN